MDVIIILLFDVFVFCPESWGLGYIISAVNRYFALWMGRQKRKHEYSVIRISCVAEVLALIKDRIEIIQKRASA